MKKKIAYWVTIVILILLFILQNAKMFVATSNVSLNLICIPLFAKTWDLKLFSDIIIELRFIWLFLGAFFLGVVLTWLYYFFVQIKTGTTVRNLNRTVNVQYQKISELEKEVEELQDGTSSAPKEVIDITDDESK